MPMMPPPAARSPSRYSTPIDLPSLSPCASQTRQIRQTRLICFVSLSRLRCCWCRKRQATSDSDRYAACVADADADADVFR